MAFWMAGVFSPSLNTSHFFLPPLSISRKPEALKPFYTLLSLISPPNCLPMSVVSMSQTSNKSCPLFISIAMTQSFFLLNCMATMPSLLILATLFLSCLLHPYNIVRDTHKKWSFMPYEVDNHITKTIHGPSCSIFLLFLLHRNPRSWNALILPSSLTPVICTWLFLLCTMILLPCLFLRHSSFLLVSCYSSNQMGFASFREPSLTNLLPKLQSQSTCRRDYQTHSLFLLSNTFPSLLCSYYGHVTTKDLAQNNSLGAAPCFFVFRGWIQINKATWEALRWRWQSHYRRVSLASELSLEKKFQAD